MEITANLRLPLLQPGQAQKELFHNESLQILDVAVAAVVEQPPTDAPPASPAIGTCYIVGGTPDGDWAGKAHHLAAFTAGGWRHVMPAAGMSVYVRSSGARTTYRDGSWMACGPIAAPTGGTQVDAEARSAVSAILSALRVHGLMPA